MESKNTSARALELGVYEQSQASIRRLKASLPEAHVADLASEVIRRLALKSDQLPPVPDVTTSEMVEALCIALISDNDTAAAEIIAGLQADGVSADVVYLKYLAAAARKLGDWWVEDRASFMEVTIGSGRMLAIMRSMRHLFTPTKPKAGRSALFASVPGETHTIGVHMATDLLRKEGWSISLKTGIDHDSLVQDIERAEVALIGLSYAGKHAFEALTRLIVATQICSPHLPILVSGQDANRMRPKISLLGVDGIASDLDDAKAQMTALVDEAETS